jgi:hypothetical protein
VVSGTTIFARGDCRLHQRAAKRCDNCAQMRDDLVLTRPAETLEGLAAKSKVLTVNIDRTEPSLGNEVTISDKRLEMTYALARNVIKLAKVQS